MWFRSKVLYILRVLPLCPLTDPDLLFEHRIHMSVKHMQLGCVRCPAGESNSVPFKRVPAADDPKHNTTNVRAPYA